MRTAQKSILIIEGEEELRSTLSRRLRSEGYLVDTASEGMDVVEKVTSTPFDLIILDIMLPGRSWGDVCRDIRQVGMATPILLLASRSQKTEAVLGLRLGADDFVTMPNNPAELLARIESLLRRAPHVLITVFARSVQSESICGEPKLPVTANRYSWLRVDTNCFDTL